MWGTALQKSEPSRVVWFISQIFMSKKGDSFGVRMFLLIFEK